MPCPYLALTPPRFFSDLFLLSDFQLVFDRPLFDESEEEQAQIP